MWFLIGSNYDLSLTFEGESATFCLHTTEVRAFVEMLQAYAQRRHLVDPWNFFVSVRRRDVVSWNKVLNACARSGNLEKTLFLFERFPERSVVSWTTVLAAVAQAGYCLDMVWKLFDEMPQRDVVSWSALVLAFTRENTMSVARRVFDKMPTHGIVAWNTLLLGYASNSQPQVALDLLWSLLRERSSTIDERTLVAGFKACARLARVEASDQAGHPKFLDKAMNLHAQAIASRLDCSSNLFLASSLIDMYSSCGSLLDARRIFDTMTSHDVVSWNALLTAYIQNHEERRALDLLDTMPCSPDRLTFTTAVKACSGLAKNDLGQEIHGKTVKVATLERGFAVHSRIPGSMDIDLVLVSSLVDMYSKCGSMIDARAVVDRLPVHETLFSDDAGVLWTSILLGYAESGEGEIALELFWTLHEIGRREILREPVFLAAIKACSGIFGSGSLRSIHGEACRRGMIHGQSSQWHNALETTLVDSYAKTGHLENAQRIFDCSTRDLLTWNALIGGYARHGVAVHGFDLFFQLVNEGLTPDSVTVLSILTLCSHTGSIDQGRKISDTILSSGGSLCPSIEHYHAVIDLLGRSNRIDEAVATIRSMPFEASAITWRTLLGACGKWKNTTRVASDAFQSLVRLDPRDTAAHDLMSKLFQRKELGDGIDSI